MSKLLLSIGFVAAVALCFFVFTPAPTGASMQLRITNEFFVYSDEIIREVHT